MVPRIGENTGYSEAYPIVNDLEEEQRPPCVGPREMRASPGYPEKDRERTTSTALCNEVGPGDLALLNSTLEEVTYLPA